MNERPAPSPPDTPPPAPLQAGRAGLCRLIASHSFSFVRRQASPHPIPSAAPRARHPHRAPTGPSPSRAGRARGGDIGTRPQPLEGHPPVHARPAPAPAPSAAAGRAAGPGGVHAAAAPRCLRSGSCRRTCLPGRGEADNGAAGEGSGTETRGPLLNLARGTRVWESFRGDPVSLAGQWDLLGTPLRFVFRRTLGRGRSVRVSEEETPLETTGLVPVERGAAPALG